MVTSIVSDFGNGNYIVAFDDDDIYTTVTDSGDVADEWLKKTLRIHRRRLSRLIVGLDVEWRPTFIRRHPASPVAVLQICVGRRCLVFQILHADFIPGSLFDFLADERFTFVGVGIQDDAVKLLVDYRLEVEITVDLRYLAANKLGMPDLRRAGLKGLVWEVMGVDAEKPHHVRVSAWDAAELSLEQVQYACTDAFASFEIGKRLINGDY